MRKSQRITKIIRNNSLGTTDVYTTFCTCYHVDVDEMMLIYHTTVVAIF